MFGAKSSIKPKAAVYRQEKVPVKKPTPIPSRAAQTIVEARRLQQARDRSASSSARSSPSARSKNGDRSSSIRPAKRKMNGTLRLSDDEADDGKTDLFADERQPKKQKSGMAADPNRNFLARSEGKSVTFIHAADTLSTVDKLDFVSGVAMKDEVVSVELRYPTASPLERFNLVFIKDQINPVAEIENVTKQVQDFYLEDNQRLTFTHENKGIVREVEKACNRIQYSLNHTKKDRHSPVEKVDKQLLLELKDAVDLYNAAIEDLSKEGPLSRQLASRNYIPTELIKLILDQVYGRTVSPKVDILKKREEQKENGKDNTYGEIQYEFVSAALKEAGLKSDQVFIDLGSGVGNVVLQAALEFGCESLGWEMVENACDLADAQKKEFAARCRLWGVQPGKVRLLRGSFIGNQSTMEAIKRADVILVNNEVFSSDTNVSLVQMFLDCKDGCKIISLQHFGESSLEIKGRSVNNPVNQLRAEKHHYYEDYVSWKHEGGVYYISTKDSTRVLEFGKRQ